MRNVSKTIFVVLHTAAYHELCAHALPNACIDEQLGRAVDSPFPE